MQGYVLHTRHRTWLQPRHTTEQSPHRRCPAAQVAVRAPSRMLQFWQRVTTASGTAADARGGAYGDGAATGGAYGDGAATGGAYGDRGAYGDGAAAGGAATDGAATDGAATAAAGLAAAVHEAQVRIPHDRQISAPHALHGIVQSGHMRCCLAQVAIGCA